MPVSGALLPLRRARRAVATVHAMDSFDVTRVDGVVTITLQRPDRKNAMRSEDWATLGDLFVEVAGRSGDRVLVVTGAGGDFCAGADLRDGISAGAGSHLDMMRLVGRTARSIQEMGKPTIAKVDGVAVGAGANLALCCDLVVASDRARFSEIFSRRGLSLDFGGSWLLPRIVGLPKAKELAFLADILDAPGALGMGLVNRVVPVEELDGFVDGWARRLADGPPIALALTKSLLDAALTSTFAQAVEAESVAQSINLASEDVKEAFAAFRDRREPVFKGR